jgi:hypothetical protein
MLLGLLLAACRREPVPVASYEWVDPAAARAQFPIFPGAAVLPEQTDLMRRARALPGGNAPEANARLALFDTGASLDEVASFYAAALGAGAATPAGINRSTGDFAADETNLAPILEKLGQRYARGATGSYRSVTFAAPPGGPRVSLQRPYRDFVSDRIVDRTLILLSD